MAKFVDPTLTMPMAIIHRFGPAPVIFKLPVLPQRMEVTFPSRTNVKPTLAMNQLDDFSGPNAVLAQLQIQGTFGHAPHAGGVIGLSLPGSVSLKEIETVYETFNALDRQTKKTLGAEQDFIWAGRAWFWRVVIKDLKYRITDREPLLFFYSITMLRLQDYLSPVAVASAVTGAASSVGGAIAGAFG